MTWKVTWADCLARAAARRREIRRIPNYKPRPRVGKLGGRPVPPSKIGDKPVTPAHIIDAEPAPPPRVCYRVGTCCWFVDGSKRWWLCEIVGRPGDRITLRLVTRWDAERLTEWPHGELLEAKSSFLRPRLRPLRYRQP